MRLGVSATTARIATPPDEDGGQGSSRPQSPQNQTAAIPRSYTDDLYGGMDAIDEQRYAYYAQSIDGKQLASADEGFLDFDRVTNQPSLRPTQKNIDKLLAFVIEPETPLQIVKVDPNPHLHKPQDLSKVCLAALFHPQKNLTLTLHRSRINVNWTPARTLRQA